MKKQKQADHQHTGAVAGLLSQLQSYCVARRMKYSEKRLMVAIKLAEIDRKIEAEELWILLKKDGYPISIASVYLNLGVLVDAGICISERITQRQALYCVRAIA
ncbi:transcriptional repressor [Sphingobacterium oryzagri]|uniref:Transcriptional repressor n=1 Tax=Sphingobacterium oryzagri TaxID=3025669 RepID=A0ABY7WJ67_9SPHI|nr:transcriptional repressor [Sphingobacterium sp. KACC 22765]WDF69648.1 transcriptional repressor [Sphingobacterium sp. KACC 22765]